MHRPSLLLALMLLGLFPLVSTPAAADTPQQKARVLLRAGSALADKGDHASALKLYLDADKLLPRNLKIYFNIADAYYEQGSARYPEAARYCERILGHRQINSVDRSYRDGVTARLNELRGKLASFAVSCKVSKAAVTLDGKPQGTTPLSARIYLLPDSKQHTLELKADGYRPYSQKIRARRNVHRRLTVNLMRLAPVKPVPAPVPPKPVPPKPVPPEPVASQPADPDPDELERPRTTGGLFGSLLVGPAWAEYGDDSLTVGTGIELGGEIGYSWRGPLGIRWLGFELLATVLYTPVSDTSVDQQMGSLNIFPGGGVRFHFGSLFAGLRFAIGPALLLGATEESFFFSGATGVSGAFAQIAIRPSLVLGWKVYKGLTVTVNPAIEYMPRLDDFNKNITGVMRIHLAVGLGWQLGEK